jgi:hypothetical protein
MWLLLLVGCSHYLLEMMRTILTLVSGVCCGIMLDFSLRIPFILFLLSEAKVYFESS